jgi:PAS domain-containing protein
VSSTSSLGGAANGGWSAVYGVLDLLAEAVTIRDREGNIAYANQAALASMGFESYEDLKRRSSRAIMDDYIVQDELGNPLALEDVPSMRLMQGATAEPLVMRHGRGELAPTEGHAAARRGG